MLLFTSVFLLSGNNQIIEAPALAQNDNNTTIEEDADNFTLCGRTLHLSDMPHAPTNSDHTQYGITNWNRSDFANATVFMHDPRGIHGRTGNQIRGFFHAYDYARDHHGPLVMHGDGFPLDTTLRKLYLGLHRKDLVERLGLIMYDTVPEVWRDGMFVLGTRWARDYVSDHSAEYTQYDMIQHRHYIIQQLYRMTGEEMELHPDSEGAKDMCASYHAFFGKDGPQQSGGILNEEHGITKRITEKYTIIHSRSFEGKSFLEEAHRHYGVDARASIDYPPDLISSILSPLGMNNNSILMITDGQNTEVPDRLASDPAIGPYFQVVPQSASTMTGDIMLAILSDVFIGNPASSFSQYIAMVRYALGLGKSYLYVRRGTGDRWEMFCDDETCFYQLHDLEAQTHQPAAPKTI